MQSKHVPIINHLTIFASRAGVRRAREREREKERKTAIVLGSHVSRIAQTGNLSVSTVYATAQWYKNKQINRSNEIYTRLRSLPPGQTRRWNTHTHTYFFKNEKLNKFKFIEMTLGHKSKGAHIFG